MLSSPLNRRTLLATLAACCGQLAGCRHTSPLSSHTIVRQPGDPCAEAVIPTIVMPPVGEGPECLKEEFHQALSVQLRKSMCLSIVEGSPAMVLSTSACATRPAIWEDQLALLDGSSFPQAVVSRITYFQPTAPIKLGVVVELKDVLTRVTLCQVEGLWDAPQCQTHANRRRRHKRACEPTWNDELQLISPRAVIEQAALEVSRDLQSIHSSEASTVRKMGGCDDATPRS